MPVSEELILEELKKVIDPELFVNIVDLGLIYEVKIEDAEVAADDVVPATDDAVTATDDAVTATDDAVTVTDDTVTATDDIADQATEDTSPDDSSSSGEPKSIKIDMTLTSPMCPAGPQLIGQSKQFVGAMEGVNDVEVKIVLDPPWSPDRMTEDARDQLGIF